VGTGRRPSSGRVASSATRVRVPHPLQSLGQQHSAWHRSRRRYH